MLKSGSLKASKLFAGWTPRKALHVFLLAVPILFLTQVLAASMAGEIAGLGHFGAQVILSFLLLLIAIPHGIAAAMIDDGPAREAQTILRDAFGSLSLTLFVSIVLRTAVDPLI